MSEFARPVRIDALGATPLRIEIAAEPDERGRMAARFGIVAIDRLVATAEIMRDGLKIEARGAIEASVTQACVATGDDVPATVIESFALRFVPDGDMPEGEVELDDTAPDTLPYAGGAIDIGEAVAQTLALALDPFPRAPGAEEKLRAAGVVEETAMSPFAALKDLGRLGSI